jgi:hypothetical protein
VLLSGTAAQAQLFGIAVDTGTLYRISPDTAQVTAVGSPGHSIWGALEFGPDGTLYAFTLGSEATLYRINPTNAAATPVGLLGAFTGEGSLAFAPDGTCYGVQQGDENSPRLFRINVNTGVTTQIGIISGGRHDINGLTFRADGVLVGLDRVTNALLRIDPQTAAASVIASVSGTVGAAGGMTVLNGQGYFSTSGPGGSSAGSNQLFRFDLFTGAHGAVGTFPNVITQNGIGGIAAVPEPAALWLALLAPVALKRRPRARGSERLRLGGRAAAGSAASD